MPKKKATKKAEAVAKPTKTNGRRKGKKARPRKPATESELREIELMKKITLRSFQLAYDNHHQEETS